MNQLNISAVHASLDSDEVTVGAVVEGKEAVCLFVCCVGQNIMASFVCPVRRQIAAKKEESRSQSRLCPRATHFYNSSAIAGCMSTIYFPLLPQVLLRKLSNEIIRRCCATIALPAVFSGDVQGVVKSLRQSITAGNKWKEQFKVSHQAFVSVLHELTTEQAWTVPACFTLFHELPFESLHWVLL